MTKPPVGDAKKAESSPSLLTRQRTHEPDGTKK
jgi:hypothetical protein